MMNIKSWRQICEGNLIELLQLTNQLPSKCEKEEEEEEEEGEEEEHSNVGLCALETLIIQSLK